MMTEKAPQREESSVRHVLRAEEEARRRIAAARREAAAAIEAARADARQLESRAIDRARSFQEASAETAGRRIRALAHATEVRMAEIEHERLEAEIQRAAAAIARELIRLDDGDEARGS